MITMCATVTLPSFSIDEAPRGCVAKPLVCAYRANILLIFYAQDLFIISILGHNLLRGKPQRSFHHFF